jgi:hypothetical protein
MFSSEELFYLTSLGRLNHIFLVFSSNSPFFENYEAFRLAPSQFPDGEAKKAGRSLG